MIPERLKRRVFSTYAWCNADYVHCWIRLKAFFNPLMVQTLHCMKLISNIWTSWNINFISVRWNTIFIINSENYKHCNISSPTTTAIIEYSKVSLPSRDNLSKCTLTMHIIPSRNSNLHRSALIFASQFRGKVRFSFEKRTCNACIFIFTCIRTTADAGAGRRGPLVGKVPKGPRLKSRWTDIFSDGCQLLHCELKRESRPAFFGGFWTHYDSGWVRRLRASFI